MLGKLLLNFFFFFLTNFTFFSVFFIFLIPPSVPMGINVKTMGSMFAPVPVEIACYEPETVGCEFSVFI